MKLMMLKAIPASLLLFLVSCASRSQSKAPVHNEGRLKNVVRFYGPNGDTGLCLYMDIWYLDSFVVEKITGHHSYTANGVTTITYPLQRYRFMDMHTMRGQDYCEFSDSAQPFREYLLTDTLKEGGWAFYTNKHPPIKEPLQWLPDTVMEGISYRRAWYTHIYPRDIPRKMMGFFRCDLQDTLFVLDREISRMAGCPMVLYHDYGRNEPNYYATETLEFISYELTAEERKVLEAWRRKMTRNR